jgi:catechol 2,3-dioxygenase
MRRADILGVHSLDHFGLVVPSLEAASRFYGAFGLDPRAHHGVLHLHAKGGDHRWADLAEGPRKALRYLSFGAFADDLPRFRERLDRLGVERTGAPPGVASEGLWFRDCDGTPLEIRQTDKTSPDAAPSFELGVPATNGRACPLRAEAAPVHPRRLAHVLVFVRDLARSLAFYRDALGLRISDEVPGGVGFMHAVHGSDHHVVAFAQSDAPGLHHSSWEVASLNEIGQGAMQMAEQGFGAGWGLGRHVLGSNYFHYVRDPWGGLAEYSGGADYIPAGTDWRGSVQTPENGFYLWGPPPPEDFTFNYEAAPEAWRADRQTQ